MKIHYDFKKSSFLTKYVINKAYFGEGNSREAMIFIFPCELTCWYGIIIFTKDCLFREQFFGYLIGIQIYEYMFDQRPLYFYQYSL